MDLVAVYAEDLGKGQSSGHGITSKPDSGVLHIDPVTQQLYGIRLAKVEATTGQEKLRMFGKVAADENRVYRVNFGTDGYVKETHADAVGDHVHKDQRLATVYAPEFLSVVGGYLSANERTPGHCRVRDEGQHGADPERSQRASPGRPFAQSRHERCTDPEVTTTRKIPENVYVVSPADGFIVARNIAPGLRFERHMDLYTIADLGRVWIFAQVSNREAGELRPGTEARVSLPDTGERLIARVSTVLPEIDPVTHTLMLLLEADNPGFRLRPNMYVDVEFHVARSSRLTVPADAVLNAGLSKRVFVETSEGNFEPREVETGWALGDRVQIVSGLTAGETVASAGTFLIDSESRLQPSQKLVHSGEPVSAHQLSSSAPSDAIKHGALKP